MFDVTGPKVLVPSILFAVMNPSLFGTHKHVGVHAFLFSILYFLICKFVVKVTVTKMDLITTTILFILLTPDILLSIPKHGGPTTLLVHTTVFAIAFAFIRGIFPEYY